MRFNKRPSAMAGAVEFPVFPAIFVVCMLLLIVGYNYASHVSFVSGFSIQPDDVQRTASSVLPGPGNKMDFTLWLTPTGAARLATYVADHPDTQIPLVFNGTLLGNLPLTKGMDTHTLHLVVDPGPAMATRYQLGK